MKKAILIIMAAILCLSMCACGKSGSVYMEREGDLLPPEPSAPTEPQLPETEDSIVTVAEGTCGDTVFWKLDSSGTLILSGSGTTDDYEKGAQNQPWIGLWKSITNLVVEDGISRVGDRAFQGFRYLQSVVLGKDVASIGEWAFQNCEALTSVSLSPDMVLETGAFRGTPVEWDMSAMGSDLYDDSSYRTALSQVALTGNYREDIINVALSQVGYHEGDSEADYAGGNTNGTGDYTEYGRRLDSVGTPWCSEFASWCFRMAKVPTDIIGSSRSANIVNFTVNTSAVWYTWYDTAFCNGSFIPGKGDIILWLWDGDTYSTEDNLSHTSILWEAEVQSNGTVLLKTIDGNSKNQVRVRSYEVDASEGTLIGRDGRLCYIIAPEYD